MAKFISKQSNYRVVLRPGIYGNRLSGQADIPGIYVKFESGIAVVDNEEIIAMLKKHGGYGKDKDFILSEESDSSFAEKRKDSEPGHTVQEMVYGHVGPKVGSPSAKEENTKLVKEMATQIAKEMVKELLPTMAKELAEKMIKESNDVKDQEIKHKITKADLNANPGLEKDVQVGDVVTLPKETK